MIISVASGKGGTGKTLVATSLAVALASQFPVQLLDCDAEEPNAHILLKPELSGREPVAIPVPAIDDTRCTYCGRCAEVCVYHAIAVLKGSVLVFPELCHGCGACSYLCPEDAISEVPREIGALETGHAGHIEFVHGRLNIGEAMAPPVIRKVKEHIDPAKTVIIDAAPGTSCPVVQAVRETDFCLLVTEPTPFGLNDLALAVAMVRTLSIPCAVVLNRDGVGDGEVEGFCSREGIPLLLRIPLDIEIARLYAQGVTLVEGKPEWQEAFVQLFEEVGKMTSARVGGE